MSEIQGPVTLVICV